MLRGLRNKAGFLLAVVFAAAAGGLATGVVMAAIPDSNGVIHGCYQSSGVGANGQIRVIDSPGQSCASGETAISWNKQTPGQFVSNLVGADFSNASLQYRNFAGEDMHGSNFTNASLNGGNFKGVNFSGSSFNGTYLDKVDFSGTDLTNGYFLPQETNDANFQNADLGGATIAGSNMIGDFRGANFNGTVFGNDDGISGNLSGIDFTNIVMQGGLFLSPTDATNTNFGGMTFNDLHVASADISGADFSGATISDSAFHDSVTAGNVNFSNASLTHVLFDGTDLSAANLSGVTWSNVTCPDGTNSDSNGNTCVGHLVP